MIIMVFVRFFTRDKGKILARIMENGYSQHIE